MTLIEGIGRLFGFNKHLGKSTAVRAEILPEIPQPVCGKSKMDLIGAIKEKLVVPGDRLSITTAPRQHGWEPKTWDLFFDGAGGDESHPSLRFYTIEEDNKRKYHDRIGLIVGWKKLPRLSVSQTDSTSNLL